MDTMAAAVVQKGHAAPHSPIASESFGRTWQREMGAARSEAPEQLPAALAAMPRIAVHEKNTEEGLGPAQEAGADGKKGEAEPEAGRAGRETAKENDAPRDLPETAAEDTQPADTQPEHAGLPEKVEACAPSPLAGKIVKSRGKHDAATAKSAVAAEGETPKADAQPGAGGPAVTNVAAAVPLTSAPASPPVALAGRAAAPEKPQAEGIRKANAGVPASHPNFEVGAAASHGVLPSATAVLAVPPSASSHPATASVGAEAGLNRARAVEGRGGNALQAPASGAAQLDVGVFDGTHGWLRIRAELGTGGAVNASLTASAGAHASLRAVLPEMASYLESEAVSVGRIALHRAATGSNAMDTAGERQSGGAPRQGAAGEQGPNGGGAQKRSLPAMEQQTGGPGIAATRAAVEAWSAGGIRAMQGLGAGWGALAGNSGGWLNVRA
jgi:hypothetical protein